MLGVSFEVAVADVTEWEDTDADPAALVAHNALLKAAAIAAARPDAIILAADTTVALAGHVLNKPVDLADARRMLLMLAGRTHQVYTALALQTPESNVPWERVVESQVTFLNFDDAVIDTYFTLVNPLDKAGAYGIQAGRDLIVAGWQGPFSNIVGLPLAATAELLRAAGVAVGPVPPEPPR